MARGDNLAAAFFTGLGQLSASLPGIAGQYNTEVDSKNKALKLAKINAQWDDILKGMPAAQPPIAPADALTVEPKTMAEFMPNIPQNIPLAGESAVDALAGGPAIDKEEWKRVMRDAMGQIESGGGKNTNHLAYAPGKKVIGPYGIDPWTWFPTIGMDPNSESDRREFANNMHLQLKALDNILEDAWTRSSGDPEKATGVYYGGPGALKKLGTDAGNSPQFALDDKGNRVQMPSINEHVKKLAPALERLGIDPKTFRRIASSSSSPSSSGAVSSSVSFAKRGDASALEELLKEKPKKPGAAMRDWTAKRDYLAQSLMSSPDLVSDPRAQGFFKMVSDMAGDEAKAGDAAMKQYNDEAGRYSQAAIAQANLEGEQYRFGQRTADAAAARESQLRLNAKKAELVTIENQLKSIGELQNAKWDKLSPEARQAIESKFGHLFTVETVPAMVPWMQPSTKKVLNAAAVSRIAETLNRRRSELNTELAQMGGSDYAPAPIGGVNPNDFMR